MYICRCANSAYIRRTTMPYRLHVLLIIIITITTVSFPLITNDPKNIIASKYMYPITKSDIKLTNTIANIASQDRNTRFDATAADQIMIKWKKTMVYIVSRSKAIHIVYNSTIEDIKYCISLQPKPTTSKPDSIPTNPNCNLRKTRLKFELTKKYIYDHLLKGGIYVDKTLRITLIWRFQFLIMLLRKRVYKYMTQTICLNLKKNLVNVN